VVIESLHLANVLKLNDAELAALRDTLSWKNTDVELLRHLMDRFSLDLVALTRGAEGALLIASSGEMSESHGQPTAVADTVGAGDAFTAALVIGLLSGLPLATINAWANRVAAYVCSQPGATPMFPDELRVE
jgi:fructokinase